MNTDVHFSSKNSEWQTPQELYDALDMCYGFSLDVACNINNCLAKKGYCVDNGYNALERDWNDDCEYMGMKKSFFLNPPYNRQIGKWVKKAYEEGQKGVTTVCLLPARTDTKWFQDYCSEGEVWFIKGRVKFFNPDTPDIVAAAPFPSCIVIFGPGSTKMVGFWKGYQSLFS